MKKALSITTVILLSLIGFMAFFTALFSEDAKFYTPFVPIVTIGLIVIIILAIYGKLRMKRIKYTAIIFLSCCFIAVISYEGYQAYEKSLEIVSSQDIDLSEYQPFVAGTKAAQLDELSTFTIQDNLPRLDGATALYPVYASFVQAVYPKKDYPLEESEVVSSQTSYAFEKLLFNDADIIFIAPPSDEQLKLAEEEGVKLRMTPIGREAFVFFVHADNPVDELTVEQIQEIYTGKITNWRDVGGANEEIRAFQRPEGSGSQSALIRMMGDKPLMIPPSKDIVSAMGGIIKETTNYQNRTNAIGFSFRHFSQEMVDAKEIKYIKVNGIAPTKENIQNGTYPFVNEFYAITIENKNTNSNIEPFLQWMVSEQGQKLVEKTGYVRIN
ncbi:PstS family phosphate ABC transporter substrate-binding protein [Bacillus andreraoultii]|uniref:PstS family phosphate ABC transporter substrate-binding protein n=1 Tax=Bacillus andreraoultii TaxID=1499685 RepID=UPI000539BBF8|nr:substrate-binding domain-containing protein [Bacillus andreraoultii]